MTQPIAYRVITGTIYTLVLGARLAGIGNVIYAIEISSINVVRAVSAKGDFSVRIKEIGKEFESCFYRKLKHWILDKSGSNDECQLVSPKNVMEKLTCFLCSPVGMLLVSMVVYPILKPTIGECPPFIHNFWDKFNIKVFKL